MDRAASRYLESLKATGYSRFTTAAVSSCLRLFREFVGECSVEEAAQRATAFLAYRSEHVKRNTLCVNFSFLKSFFAFCVEQGWVDDNPLRGMRNPKPEEVTTLPLTDSEIIGLINAAQQWQRAAVILLLGTGMRIGELAALRWEDLRDGTLTVHGKGGKQRTLAPGSAAMRELMRLPRADGRVFPGSYHAIKKALVELSRRSGIRFHPHQLRHTFADRYLRAGGDIETLSAILGHASLDTTGIYVKAFRRERTLESMRQRNPADALLGSSLRSQIVTLK